MPALQWDPITWLKSIVGVQRHLEVVAGDEHAVAVRNNKSGETYVFMVKRAYTPTEAIASSTRLLIRMFDRGEITDADFKVQLQKIASR